MTSSVGMDPYSTIRAVEPIDMSSLNERPRFRRGSFTGSGVLRKVAFYEEKVRLSAKEQADGSPLSRKCSVPMVLQQKISPPPKPKRTFAYQCPRTSSGRFSKGNSVHDSGNLMMESVVSSPYRSRYAAIQALRVICEDALCSQESKQPQRRISFVNTWSCCFRLFVRIGKVFRRALVVCLHFFQRRFACLKSGVLRVVPCCCPQPKRRLVGDYSYSEEKILRILVALDDDHLQMVMRTEEMRVVCVILGFRPGFLEQFPDLASHHRILTLIDKLEEQHYFSKAFSEDPEMGILSRNSLTPIEAPNWT